MDNYTFVLVLTIFALFLFSVISLFVVKQQTVVIIERLGKFNRVCHPGLNFLIPFIDKKVEALNLRIHQLNLQVETKTEDNVFVKLMIAVQYQVIYNKIYEAYYKLNNPAQQIQAFVFDVVRARVPNIKLDDLFARKDEIAVDVKQELQEVMESFGYEIIKTLVTDIDPNESVKNAMNEINTALRLRVAAQERAEAEKIMRIKQAEGEAEANILHGKGVAGQRQALIEGVSMSVEKMQQSSPEISSSSIMSTILLIQYFDMLKDIGASSKTNTLFMSHSPNAAANLQEQLLAAMSASTGVNKNEENKQSPSRV